MQNRRQKVFNRGLCLSAGELCVCVRVAWHHKNWQKLNWFIVFPVSFWGLGALFGGLSPQKPPLATGLLLCNTKYEKIAWASHNTFFTTITTQNTLMMCKSWLLDVYNWVYKLASRSSPQAMNGVALLYAQTSNTFITKIMRRWYFRQQRHILLSGNYRTKLNTDW